MVAEYHFENDFVVKYLVDELGYHQVPATLFNGTSILIPSELEAFIWQENESICKDILRKEYAGDKKAFTQDLCHEVSNFVYSMHNAAVYLHPKKLFKFKNKYFLNLYRPFNKASDDQNHYSIVSQPVCKLKTIQGLLQIIPDVAIFINGIMVSFLQLKLVHRNQRAVKEGRGQIIGDYLEAVQRACVDVMKTNPVEYFSEESKKELIRQTMKMFHGPMHMVAMDSGEAYVMRGIEKYYTDAEKLFASGKADDSGIKGEILKTFFADSICTKEPTLSLAERSKKILANLYGKQNLQNEILYFNFLAYQSVSNQVKGKKERVLTTRTPVLSFPRPNQKYGVEKVIAEVINKYQHEDNPDYEFERLEKKLINLNIPLELRERTMKKRKDYKNQRNQFSILLQYAAGFGKTYILCWLALMLKDLMNPRINTFETLEQKAAIKGKTIEKMPYLFDKILIVSDRVDLRDQVERAMQNMNIEKSLFAEAEHKESLKKHLMSQGARIVIVNIQKFPFLKEVINDAEMGLLQDKRIAFLIDEVHRSNSGEQHHSMTNIFDDIADSLGSSNGISQNTKKNLIIGLTATPTDENLARFGEFQGCLEDIKWTPFDAYTMKEAIDDGFILNPTQAMIPVAIEMQFAEEDKKRLPGNQKIYEHDERIRAIAKKTADVLVSTTFKKIYGYGKGMLACYSIASAKKYYDYITEELAELTQKPPYARYKEAKVYMVYTHNQEDAPAHVICGYGSEKEVIAAFKSDKNGLMIVVDKLQTGFDEPKLHTLFLDKEVSGINAVQTVCRINRTTKNKEDCMLVDYSIDNVNIKNIRSAFDKYAGIVVSEFNSYSIKEQVESAYKKVMTSEVVKKFLPSFKLLADFEAKEKLQSLVELEKVRLKIQSDPNFKGTNTYKMNLAFCMQQYIEQMFTNEHSKKIICADQKLFLEYIHQLGLIDNVIGIDAKYKEPQLLMFMREVINLIKGKVNAQKESESIELVDFWFENLGLIESAQIVYDNVGTKKAASKLNESKAAQASNGQKSKYNVLNLIKEKNKKEKEKEILMHEFEEKLYQVFDQIKHYDKTKNDERLLLKLANLSTYTDIEISQEFTKVWGIAERRLKNNDNLKEFVIEISDSISLLEADFIEYLK